MKKILTVVGDDSAAPTCKAAMSPGRREALLFIGKATAASALAACGGTEMMMPPGDTGACMGQGTGIVATGAETLQVGQLKRFDQTPAYKGFFICRDAQGFYCLANICMHAGCQTSFNTTAMSFDCPCHGSRYKFDGSILNGPTTNPMSGYMMCKRSDGIFVVDNENPIFGLNQRIK